MIVRAYLFYGLTCRILFPSSSTASNPPAAASASAAASNRNLESAAASSAELESAGDPPMLDGTATTSNDSGNAAPYVTSSRRDRNSNSRVPMQGFVFGRTMSGIRSPAHGTALISLLQLAGAHEDCLQGSLGHGHRTTWIDQNRDAFYQAGGPLAAYNALSSAPPRTLATYAAAPTTMGA
jgi:hypothetical protein